MTTDIHPLIVHFPIALLSLYVGIEVLSLLVKSRSDKLFVTKVLLLFIGTVSAMVALETGEIAEGIMWYWPLVETHSTFAEAAYIVFGILSAIYLARFIIQSNRIKRYMKLQWTILNIIKTTWVHILISIAAIAWFWLLVITGALGAALAYGPEIDPIVNWIYTILVH